MYPDFDKKKSTKLDIINHNKMESTKLCLNEYGKLEVKSADHMSTLSHDLPVSAIVVFQKRYFISCLEKSNFNLLVVICIVKMLFYTIAVTLAALSEMCNWHIWFGIFIMYSHFLEPRVQY